MPESFPVFESGQTYLLKGETLNSIVKSIKTVKVVTGGGLKIVSETDHEIFLALDPGGLNAALNTVFGFGTLNLDVCIGGQPTSRVFLTKI